MSLAIAPLPEVATRQVPVPPGRMTYEEFLDWVPEDFRAEWVDGAVLPMPPPNIEHQTISAYLSRILGTYVEIKELGLVLAAPVQMKVGPELGGREPDILFLQTARLDRLRKVFVNGPADLVVEIISPEHGARDRGEKFYEYEAGGVREYWIIDPPRRAVEFHQLNGEGIYETIPLVAGRYESRALPGMWLEIGWLWERPPLLEVLRAWGLLG